MHLNLATKDSYSAILQLELEHRFLIYLVGPRFRPPSMLPAEDLTELCYRNSYQSKLGLILVGDVLSSKHRTFKKNYETEILVDSIRLPLNHFMQETLANMMIGFLKTLKQVEEEAPTNMEIRIKKLPKQVEVDAHTYP